MLPLWYAVESITAAIKGAYFNGRSKAPAKRGKGLRGRIPRQSLLNIWK